MIHNSKVLVILGPTAVGKSALAVRLAKKFNGEVVSADSRQVYRGLNIGTGKITKSEMRRIRHHLLNVADPKKQYSVAQYVTNGSAAIAAIAARGKLPIVIGGTGFYISALLGDEKIPDVPPNKKLRAKLARKTASELFRMLLKKDPVRARNIDKYNSRRLIRAIEIAYQGPSLISRTDLDIGVHNIKDGPSYNTLLIGITLPKENLRQRISMRLFSRISRGMIVEARRLHMRGLSWKRMGELGLEYRYLARFLQGKMSREEMIRKLETEIWRYAKRQMTWFKRYKSIQWFNPSEETKIQKSILKFLRAP